MKGAITAINQIGSIIKQVNEISATIASAVGQQSQATNEIARSVSEAARGTTEITQSVANVDAAARDTATGANDCLRAATQLAELSSHLKAIVGKNTF